MKWFIVILILAVVLIAGCTMYAGFQPNYVQKTPSVKTPDYWYYWDKVYHNCDFSNSTRILNCTWDDTSGYLTRIHLEVRRIINLNSEVWCENTSTASSGTFICNFGPVGNQTFSWNMWGEFK